MLPPGVSEGSPAWLENCKAEIVDSDEWREMATDLFGAIHQQLAQSHVTYFTDLTEAEKSLFMDRAIKSIQHSECYGRMMKQVSLALDRHLSNEVARELFEDEPFKTKPELVMEHAREGATSILRRWPEMKGKIHCCLNQRLPESLRHISWKLFLQNTVARKLYCDTRSDKPASVRSSLESEIFQKCEALLTAVPVFARAFLEAKTSSAIASAMSKVLSYYHARLNSGKRLIDANYLVLIPLMNASTEIGGSESITSRSSVATLVEEYISIVDYRPPFVRDCWGETFEGISFKDFCKLVAEDLNRKDGELANHISSVLSTINQKQVNSNSGEVLAVGLQLMLKPLVRSMFVGFLEVPVVMYVWDQFVMGVDVPQFEVFGPYSVLILLLLREPLLKSTDSKQLEDVVQRQTISITLESLQYEFKKLYFKELYATLVSKDSLDVPPVVDPVSTFGAPAAWVHWMKEWLPDRTTPRNRRYAREQRAALKLRQLRDEEEPAMFGQQMHQKALVEQGTRRMADLEQELEAERRKREELERRAEEEISQLQYQLQKMRRLSLDDDRVTTGNKKTPHSEEPPSASRLKFPSPTPPPPSSA